MILLIDSGNTALKYSFVKEGKLLRMFKINHTSQNIADQLNKLISLQKDDPVKSIFISNVAGKGAETELTRWCQETFRLDPIYAVVTKKFNGLLNAYNPVEKLGVDRWMALIAATDCFKTPICIVDAGTAVTIDAIDDTQQYIGGVILPGLALMRQSLQQNTDAISLMQEQNSDQLFAKNTEQGVLSGTALAVAASVDRMTETLQKQTNKSVTCVVTGGDANQIISHINQSVEHVPDLVLKGLYRWGQENGLDG